MERYKTKEKNKSINIKIKTKTKTNIKRILIIATFFLILIINISVFADSNEIVLKPGESVKRELVPDLKYYEVLSLNQNGEGTESVEKHISTENYDITFRLEGVFGDKFVAEIKAKKEGISQQEIKYYVYKEEGKPFTPYRSEIVINVKNDQKEPEKVPEKTENKEETKPENNKEIKAESNKNSVVGDEKITMPASEINEKPNKKLIKVYPQNANYLTLGSVYLREGNSVGTNSLVVIPEGTNVVSNGYTGDGWVRVTYNGKTGFISANYIALQTSNNLTDEMKKEAKKEEEEYQKELKKVGFVNSKGKKKEEQIKELEKNIGSIPNVGKNLQFKIFLLISIIAIVLAGFVIKNKTENKIK